MTPSTEEIDLLDLDRWARHRAPHAWFAARHEQAAVWRHPSPGGGPGFWVVSCPHVLSSDDRVGGVTGLGPGDELEAIFARSRQTNFLHGSKHLPVRLIA